MTTPRTYTETLTSPERFPAAIFTVKPRGHGMETPSVFVGLARSVFVVRVSDHQRGVQIDRRRPRILTGSRSGDRHRQRPRLPRPTTQLRPDGIPRRNRRADCTIIGKRRQGAARGRYRRDRTEQTWLALQHLQVPQPGLAIGQHHRQIVEHRRGL